MAATTGTLAASIYLALHHGVPGRGRGLRCAWPLGGLCTRLPRVLAGTYSACSALSLRCRRRLAKHEHPQPLKTELGLLHDKEEPKNPPNDLYQYIAILCTQGGAFEPLDQGFAFRWAQVQLLVRALHHGRSLRRRSHPALTSPARGSAC